MLRICIVALIGLPAAGKTTFSSKLLSMKQNNFNVIHLCYDNFFNINADTNLKIEHDYKTQRLEIFNILNTLVHLLKSKQSLPMDLKNKINISKCAISNDKFLILCDDNHFYRSMRYKLYQFCRDNYLAYAQIEFTCSLSDCLKRNAKRVGSAKIPNNVIEEMHKRFEVPNEQEFFWEHNTLILDAFDEESFEKINTFLFNSFDNVLKPLLNKTKLIQAATTIHQLDLLLRRHIKDIVQNVSNASEKETKALLLNAKRKEILHNLKESKVEILNKEALPRTCLDTSAPCTFPHAHVSLTKKQQLLMVGQAYKVIVNIEMPESPQNLDLGMFMVCAEMRDSSSMLRGHSCRSAMMRYRSPLIRTISTWALSPLFVLGLKEEFQRVPVEIFTRYLEERMHPITDVYVEIQSQKIQFYTVSLHIVADFTGLRYIMYNWPVISAIVAISTNLFFILVVFLLSWYHWSDTTWLRTLQQKYMRITDTIQSTASKAIGSNGFQDDELDFLDEKSIGSEIDDINGGEISKEELTTTYNENVEQTVIKQRLIKKAL